MKKLLLLYYLFLFPIIAGAYDFEVDGIRYNILSQEERKVEVTYKGSSFWNNEYSGDISIPEIVVNNGINYDVISLGEYVFYGCNISSISLPECIETIEKFAFYGNSSLKEIKFPSKLKRIEESAFDRTGLTSLSLPSSIQYIASAFYQTSISKIYVTDLETWLNIKYENCPANGAYYGQYDLYINNNIVQNLVIPDGFSEIKNFSFCCCKSIISITLPNSINKIGNNAFYCCGGLGYVNLPQNIKQIGSFAFYGNKGLSFSYIPESVEEIGSYAFSGTNITSIKWPSNVETIPEECFSSCPLKNITIPNTVKTIGVSAFLGCKFEEIDLPESIETIEGYAFDFCQNLKNIKLPSSVKTIGSHIFARCHGLESVKLNEGLESIGEYAFDECRYLKEVNIPSTITEIKKGTFNGCNRLPSIILPSSISLIGISAFAGCNALGGIISLALEPPFIYGNSFENFNIPVYVPKGKKEAYKQANGWSQFSNIIELIDKYKLVYYVDDILYKEYEIEEGEAISPEPSPTKEGYTFSGWSEIPETMPAHDVTVNGTFTINKYKLIYNVDGKEYKSYELDYGAMITPEPAPTKEGYTFSGWSEIPETMPAQDVTVTGTFSVNKYKLTYTVDGEEYKSYEVEYGTAITPEPAPIKKGYTFRGWTEIPETMPAHDVTVKGTFNINKYKLTYIVDVAEYKSYELEYGASITPEAEPTKEGYTFSGWSEIPETMPAHDVTVTGAFSINSYKLSYMIDDQVYKETMYEYGATITPEPQPEGDYATFEWTNLPPTMPAHDVVVYASYTSGINKVLMTPQRNIRIYSPNGKKRDKLQKGLNIVIQEDGTVKKFIVK